MQITIKQSKISARSFFDGALAIVRVWVTPQPYDSLIASTSVSIWALNLGMAGAVIVLSGVLGFRLDWAKLVVVLAVYPLLAAVIALVRRRTRLQAIPTLLECVLQMLFAIFFGILLSFILASIALPYSDAALVRADGTIGFDWLSHARFVQEAPVLRAVLRWAYGSLAWQVPAALVVLGLVGRPRRLQTFVLTYIGTMIVCALLSAAMPARSPAMFFGLTDPSRWPISGVVPSAFEVLESLRAASNKELFSYEPSGIVTFPSFHATSAILLAYAFWSIPYVRWPMLAINGLMLVATPSVGSHYLVDTIAGVAIALLAICLATRWSRTRPIDQ